MTGHCHYKECIFKLGLVGSPGCDKCKQAPSTASHVLGNCMVLAKLKFQRLGHDFMKPGALLTYLSARYCTLFKVGASECLSKRGAQKIKNCRSASVAGMPAFMYSVMHCHLFT